MQIEIPKPNGKVDLDYIYKLTDVLQLYVNMTHNEITQLKEKKEGENVNGNK